VEGTVNSVALGSPVEMLVNSISVLPMRGSVLLICTGTWRSVEIQVIRVFVIGCELPIAPAGITSVICVPVACTPLTV
jgi:hypothetical protein